MIYFEKLLPWLEPAISRLDHSLQESSCDTLTCSVFKDNTTLEFQHITSVLSFEDEEGQYLRCQGHIGPKHFLDISHLARRPKRAPLQKFGGFLQLET